VLLFLVTVFGGQFGFLLFQKTVFKIIPGFQVFAFFAPVLYGNSGFIFMQAFFWLDTVTIFFL
jgi:hypothetical protein